MTDFLDIIRVATVGLLIIGLILCMIAWRLNDIGRSLKKIANRDNTVELKLPDDTSSLHRQIGQIAWEAGRNFQHGMRTDR